MEPVEGRERKGGRVEEGRLQERKRDGWAEGAVLSGGRLELTWAPLSYTPLRVTSHIRIQQEEALLSPPHSGPLL